ncbi:phosphate regulon sensor histidine kinase PhoR [Spongiibacter sp. KMU-158]|uniref:histidine kinase n=1 Tax=Spongiibacter pelagi TaxID=2760804 RepID=A0A927C2W4_9GAMM|nr:phosphate regulon sensor histidine kinase PhoR [Spongiibacter pelagi]MBD2859148.1 phosphate regulon sensor histidine kinase PhoR [Spongiibacter pelagi]
MQGIQTEIWRALGITLFSFLFGLSIGYPYICVIIGGVIYLIWTLRTIYRTFHWIEAGLKNPAPYNSGVWGDLANALARQKRRDLRRKKRLQEAVKRMSSLIAALDQGILVLNRELGIDIWNNSAKHLLGLKSSDRGTAIINLIRQPEFIDYMQKQDFSDALEMPSPLHKGMYLSVHAANFGKKEIVLVFSDITRVRNLDQLRREFVGNVSHELRTPLTVLQGYIETLQNIQKSDNPMVGRAFSQMEQQIKRMRAISDDLILLSKLETENELVQTDPIPLLPVLKQIANEAKQLSEGLHNVTLDCSDTLKLSIKANDLHSAIGNIVFNAVQHNPQGCDIRISAHHYGRQLVINIEDNGIGIPEEALPRITERFYRADSSRNSQTGGSGLGMAIVKHLLNRYDGELSISSSAGRGAKFSCKFPVHK